MTDAVSADEAAFLSAIAAEPGEDTPRLVYADWLEERGTPGDAARAEFIRVQVELATLSADHRQFECLNISQPGVRCRDPLCPTNLWKRERDTLCRRESALLKLHEAEWRKGPVCSLCRGEKQIDTGYLGYVPEKLHMIQCPSCRGTGDAGGLAHWAGVLERNGGWAHRVDFRRGFPAVVHAALGEVVEEADVPCFGCDGKGTERFADAAGDMDDRECTTCRGRKTVRGWQPTDWAKRVVKAHPVTEFWATDRVPHHNGYGHAFFNEARERPSGSVPAAALLPQAVFAVMYEQADEKTVVLSAAGRFVACLAPDATATLLAQALGLIVRAEAYRP